VPTGNRARTVALRLDGGTPWYVPPALGRTGAHRSVGARVAPLCLALIALAGCGSGTRQDSDEPKGNFPVQIVDASFPTSQRLAKTSNMTIVVRNPGPKTVPVVSVTVKCASAKGGSGGSPSGTGSTGGFSYRTTYPGVADPARPRFIVNEVPTRTPRVYNNGRLDPLERSSSYVDTFPLGALAPGRSVTFRWNVTAVKSGKFRICYRVNAGLDGKAHAVPARSDETIDGEFTGEVKQKPVQAHIGEDDKTVVQGAAGSTSTP
jgi:hypothetical protein